MYLVTWVDDEKSVIAQKKVQYLPDIQEVIRKAFGEDKAVVVTVEKED